MRAYLRARVAAELGPLVDAQIAQAKGLKYLVTRDKETGKFIRVGPALARARGEETIEVWEKDPSTAAWDSLANRAMDKPTEPEQRLDVRLEEDLLRRLHEGRQRVAQARRQREGQGETSTGGPALSRLP